MSNDEQVIHIIKKKERGRRNDKLWRAIIIKTTCKKRSRREKPRGVQSNNQSNTEPRLVVGIWENGVERCQGAVHRKIISTQIYQTDVQPIKLLLLAKWDVKGRFENFLCFYTILQVKVIRAKKMVLFCALLYLLYAKVANKRISNGENTFIFYWAVTWYQEW